MSYSGSSFYIDCSRGGLNANRNESEISPNDMVSGAKNLNLQEGGRQKRGGTARVTAEIESGAQIYGLFDYLKPAGTQYIVFATSGKIYKNSTTTIKTGWTASKLVWFSQFDGELYCCNGSDTPGKWDGTTFTTLTDIPTDWSTNKPKYMITHGRGNSERNWAFGCPSTPYTIYASPNGDGDDFSDANVTTIAIDTKDGYGLMGGIVYVDQLIMFGRRQAYIVDDSDTNTTNWGYDQAPWQGGAAHQRLIIPTPNDIVCVDENMEVYSLVAAQTYGDYEIASIARPSFIHNWIKDNVREAYITNFHGIYDPVNRAVKIFVVRTGQTTIDTALVYYIDRGPKDGWMIHDNLNYASGYNASCSALVYVGAGDYEIYTGDYSGYIWKLEQSAKNDNSNAFSTSAKSPKMDAGNAEIKKNFKMGRLVCSPQGTETINFAVYVDGSQIDAPSAWVNDHDYSVGDVASQSGKIYECLVAHTSATATNKPGSGSSWTTYWEQHRFSITIASGTKNYAFNIGQNGTRIQLDPYNNLVTENFLLEKIYIDYKNLGIEPE